MKALNSIKNLLTKDGATVKNINLFGDVLIVDLSLNSLDQIKRFNSVGNSKGMFKNSEIEVKENKIIFSALMAI